MESLDVRVLREVYEWRAGGVPVLLATVVSTWGSSPRPVGSIMAISAQGSVVGSVSGGCIEDDLIHKYVGRPAGGPPKLVRYGVTADEAHRFGLPCGGTMELLLEYDPDAGSLRALVESLDEGRLVGIIAQADLAVHYAGLDLERETEVEEMIERVSEPARPRWHESGEWEPRSRHAHPHGLGERVREGWEGVKERARDLMGGENDGR